MRFFSFDSVWEGGCGRHVPQVLPQSPLPHARVDSECKRWNLEHVVLDLFTHFTVGKVQDRWLLVSCRGSRSLTSPFALSRLANLTHAVAARLSLRIPSWQHFYHRVLRELDIEFEPTIHWTSSFFTACSYRGSSRRFATATRRVRLTLQESVNSCSCASSTCALASESHRIAYGTRTRQLRAWFQKSRVSPCLRFARLRHGHTCCKHERRHVDTDCL